MTRGLRPDRYAQDTAEEALELAKAAQDTAAAAALAAAAAGGVTVGAVGEYVHHGPSFGDRTLAGVELHHGRTHFVPWLVTRPTAYDRIAFLNYGAGSDALRFGLYDCAPSGYPGALLDAFLTVSTIPTGPKDEVIDLVIPEPGAYWIGVMPSHPTVLGEEVGMIGYVAPLVAPRTDWMAMVTGSYILTGIAAFAQGGPAPSLPFAPAIDADYSAVFCEYAPWFVMREAALP